MAGRPRGISSAAGPPRPSGEGVIEPSLFVAGGGEPTGLQIEHGPVPAAGGDELVVGAELHDPAVFENADAVGPTDSGEAVGDQDGGDRASGFEQAFEDGRFAAHVELG